MGTIISRIRRKPSAKEKLEKLDKSIKSLEQYHFSTEQRQKHLIGALLLYSILIYIVAFGVFYFLYFPKDKNRQILYIIPLLLFPVLVYLVKRFLHWYFRRKIRTNDSKLVQLRKEKKQILEKVMETETYKVAKELLDKFDPDKQNEFFIFDFITQKPSSTDKLKQTSEEMELRRRTDSARGVTPSLVKATPTNGTGVLSAVPTPRGYVPMPNTRSPALVRPILAKDRGVADRLVEYLIGDGPNNRYALVCRRCNSHNGMALKEEFEFLAFRCCYCHFPNPAKKQRPHAPKLPESPRASPQSIRKYASASSSSPEDTKSEGDTEEEVMSDPEEKTIQSKESKADEKLTEPLKVDSDEKVSDLSDAEKLKDELKNSDEPPVEDKSAD